MYIFCRVSLIVCSFFFSFLNVRSYESIHCFLTTHCVSFSSQCWMFVCHSSYRHDNVRFNRSFFVSGFLGSFCLYVTMLLWEPDRQAPYEIFILFSCLGIFNSLYQTTFYSEYSTHLTSTGNPIYCGQERKMRRKM